MDEIRAIVEAVLFAADLPVAPERLVELLKERGVDRQGIVAVLEDLREEYAQRRGGMEIRRVAGGYQFCTRPDLAAWIRRYRAGRPPALSAAALETLAVVAYRQPVTKAEIDAVRGVDAGGVLKGLLERKLIRIVGRKEVPGRPILYGTTKRFLEVFHLKDLSELPTLEEMRALRPEGEPGGGTAP